MRLILLCCQYNALADSLFDRTGSTSVLTMVLLDTPSLYATHGYYNLAVISFTAAGIMRKFKETAELELKFHGIESALRLISPHMAALPACHVPGTLHTDRACLSLTGAIACRL